MTTIAYRDGVLAGDTRITNGDGENIVMDHHRKVHRLRDGRLFGWCGGLEQSEIMLRHLRGKCAMPHLDDLACMIVDPDGTIHQYEGRLWAKRLGVPYFAIGSGAMCAYSAMDAGASAPEAVRIAIKRNTSTGGRVVSVRLKKKGSK